MSERHEAERGDSISSSAQSSRQRSTGGYSSSSVGDMPNAALSMPPIRTFPRVDPASLPPAGLRCSWTSANDDYRRERVQREDENKVRHTHVEWWKGDPTRKEIYPDPKPKSSSTIPNKPDYQLDITDIEGARPRSRPRVDHHRSVSSPTTRGLMTMSLRETNPLTPCYPWGTDSEQRTFPQLPCYPPIYERKACGSNESLRYSTGSLTNHDIDGARTVSRYLAKEATDPQRVDDIDGAVTRRRHPEHPPARDRPQVHTRPLGRWCYGDSGHFTQFPREAPVDPNGPDYKYDPYSKEFRQELEAFARDQKTVPRTWDPLTGEPHEIVGKLERMGWHRQARSRYGRKKAMMQMYTARPTRTFDYTVPGRRFNETR